MTKAVESGMPKLRIEEAAARRQARVGRGDENDRRRQQVPARERAPIESREIDNTEVRASSSSGWRK
jgi:methylmalonyl-CoA mutase N-terminal domain/subunit